MELFKKLRDDAGVNFSLSNIFLFAQIPDPYVALPSALISAGVLFRALVRGKIAKSLDKVEAALQNRFFAKNKLLGKLGPWLAHEMQNDRPGSTLIRLGFAQNFIFAGSLLVAAMNPLSLAGWMAAGATGFFAASNMVFGTQLNNPQSVRSDKTWRDVLSSPQFLSAAGVCCSGMLAGLAGSFGVFAAVPIAAALGAGALIATGKIGALRLNKGAPMMALAGVSAINAVVGVANGLWLAALTNVFAVQGNNILTQHYAADYYEGLRAENLTSPQTLFQRAMRQVFYRETKAAPSASVSLTSAPAVVEPASRKASKPIRSFAVYRPHRAANLRAARQACAAMRAGS